jgi:hypothetical protein
MNEQQTKYPWHLAPDWAMWAATDEDGYAHWSDNKPEVCPFGYWTYDLLDLTREIGYFPELRADWQKSLEKHPGT